MSTEDLVHDDSPSPSGTECVATSHVKQEEVLRMPNDLVAYRNRIDANTEEQRKNRDVIAALNEKILEFRKQNAKTSAQFTSQTLPIDSTSFHDFSSINIRSSSYDVLMTSHTDTISQPLMSSTAIESDLLSTEDFDQSLNFMLVQLEEEIQRNEKIQGQNFVLQNQVDGMLQANETMKEEISKMSTEVDMLKEERESERSQFLQQDERKRYVFEAQNRRLLDLWRTYNRMKREVQDFRRETENDLDRQKTEFVRCANNMEIALKHASLQQPSSGGSGKEDGALDEVLKEYEDLTTRYLKVVEEQNEKERKVAELEAAVRKSNEERDAAQDSLKKILLMPELTAVHSRKSRSLSPSGRLTSDTIQLVRTALRDQESDIRRLEWEREQQKSVIIDLEGQLARSEETRKVAKQEILGAERELEILRREKEDAQLEHNRLNEKIAKLDFEKVQSLMNTERIQSQIVTLTSTHQTTVEDILQKQVDECNRLRKRFENEKKELESDNTFKLEKLKLEVERYKDENEANKEALNTALSDCNTLRARLKEKESESSSDRALIKELKEDVQRLEESLTTVNDSNAGLEQKLQHMQSDAVKNNQKLIEVDIEKRRLVDEQTSISEEHRQLKVELLDKQSTIQKLQNTQRELSNSTNDLQNELFAVKSKLSEEEMERQELLSELEHLKRDKTTVEEQLHGKTRDLASCASQCKQLEEDHYALIHDLDAEREKNGNLETVQMRLRAENERLSQDLAIVSETLEKKTTLSQKALNEMVENYRSVERAHTEAVCEKEALVEEISSLKDQLNSCEESRRDLHKNLSESETARKGLLKKLHRFEECAKKALNMTGTDPTLRGRTVHEEPVLLGLNVTSPGSFYHLRNSASSHNIGSPHVSFDFRGIESSSNQLDISSSVEITFSVLRNRIEELESKKKVLDESVARVTSEMQHAEEKRKESSRKTDQLQKKVSELEEERRSLESRVASSRQLLLSQEENLRSKDQQQKSLKARILSADLHSRDKDAKIASLNDVISSMKAEISSLEEDKRSMKETVTLFELERAKADALQREADDGLLKYRTELTNIHNKNKDLMSRLEEAEQQASYSQKRCVELEKTIQEYRGSIQNLKKDESVWKRRADSLERKESEEMDKQQRIDQLQMEHEEYAARYKAVVKEREALKHELQETKTQHSRCTTKVAELQQTIFTLTHENTQMQQRLSVLEKRQKDGRSLGSLLREELEQLRAEKVTSAADKQDLTRRLQKAEAERREAEAQRARLERERAALKQHVETLELEKQKTDQATKQTGIERLALDKSLSAMEKENRELYKNCSQLQKQVSQLEKENGNTLLRDSVAQRRLLETKLQRVTHEKQDIELKLEQCERAYSHANKLLESKITVLNKQLEAERKRRGDLPARGSPSERDVSDRSERSGSDDTAASLQRLAALRTPTKSEKGSTSSLRSRSSNPSKSPSKK